MKRNFIKMLSICLCLALTAACGTAAATESQAPDSAAASQEPETVQGENAAASSSGREVPEAGTRITFNSAVSVEGVGAQTDGGTVTITAGGVYSLEGSSSDGRVVVQAPGEDVTLVLDGLDLLNPDGAAILIEDAGSAMVWISDGSENTLEDGGESTEYDGALYSCVSLTIDGMGSLEVTGNREEGIASEEHLTIDGGILRVTAADDGLNANQDGVSLITINGGNLTVLAGGDGIDSNGSMEMNGGTVLSMASLDDMSGGIDVDGEFLINGGTLVATGISNSLPSQDSTQRSLSLTYKETQSGGTQFRVMQGEEELIAVSPEKDYKTLLFSSAELTEGTYAVWAGEIQQTHKDAAEAGEFAASELVTRFSSVTFLEDTDFVDDEMQGPPGGGFGRPGDDRKPPEGMEPPEGMTPPDGERPSRPNESGAEDGSGQTEV